MKDPVPQVHGAAIILYDQNGDTAAARDAYKKIAQWGYNRSAFFRADSRHGRRRQADRKRAG